VGERKERPAYRWTRGTGILRTCRVRGERGGEKKKPPKRKRPLRPTQEKNRVGCQPSLNRGTERKSGRPGQRNKEDNIDGKGKGGEGFPGKVVPAIVGSKASPAKRGKTELCGERGRRKGVAGTSRTKKKENPCRRKATIEIKGKSSEGAAKRQKGSPFQVKKRSLRKRREKAFRQNLKKEEKPLAREGRVLLRKEGETAQLRVKRKNGTTKGRKRLNQDHQIDLT